MKLAVAAVLACGCLMTPVIPIGSGKSAKESQREQFAKMSPPELTSPKKWSAETRTAKIRVWADDEYRAQNVRWEHAFEEQLDYANQVLVPLVGLRLEAEYRSWDRHAPGSTLEDALAELGQVDRGEGVLTVVGLTSSLTLAEATFDKIGYAELGGQYMVMRGHADVAEAKAFDVIFRDLKPEQRTALLEARRRHKTTSVFLHELGHNLGALHETAADTIMSPTYSVHATTFGDRNRELMVITLEDRLKSPQDRDPRATAEKLLAATDVEWDGWVTGDREKAVARLRGRTGGPTVFHGSGALPPPVIEQLHHAEELLAAKDVRGAQAALEPLLAAYPATPQIWVLKCKLELARGGPKDGAAIATCDRAAGFSADVGPAVEIASALLAKSDPAGARRTLAAAETRISSLSADKAAEAWLALADEYRAMDALTWAEAAVAKAGTAAGADHGIAGWATTTRARYGIPREGKRWRLAPEDDATALTAVREVLGLVNGDKLDAAARAAASAEQRWPALPGLLAARCDLELRRKDVAAARRLCARAVAEGGSSWALYLSGILALRDPGQTAAGIARLRAAIKLDPELGQAWRALGKALDRAKATAELDQLRKDYQQQFGQAL